MTLWLVKEEFVPIQGAPERSNEDLAEIAASVRLLLAANNGAAHGSGDRFVASAKVEAEDQEQALAWGRTVLYGTVTDALTGWRLERIDAWPD